MQGANSQAVASRIFVIVLVVIVVGFGWVVWREYQTQQTVGKAPATPSLQSTDPVQGSPNARVVILEYGDFGCDFCRALHPTLRTLLAKYQGQVLHVWKDFPNTEAHPEALDAAEAARCAQEQGAFWEMHNLLFTTTEDLSPPLYQTFSETLHLDPGIFQECLDSDRMKSVIQESFDQGRGAGVDGTPYLFINDIRITELPSQESLDDLLTQLLRS